jgi:peptidoglycan/xylan/chitin deacetylase (PgdA/CDA1 family)
LYDTMRHLSTLMQRRPMCLGMRHFSATTPSAQRVPILIYHHVYREDAEELRRATFETGSGVIGEAMFRRQMDYLVDQEVSVVGTSDVIAWINGKRELPKNAAVLHFDNGWLDSFTVVAPILQEYGYTATLFPITDGLEAASRGEAAAVRTVTEGVVSKPFMTWAQARELQNEYGWEMGGHTATHCKIAEHHAEHGDSGVITEAETSNKLFELHLGAPPAHFAYPSGSRTSRTDDLLLRKSTGGGGYYESLRLWEVSIPPEIDWKFTSRTTPLHAIEGQNIDLRVPFEDFTKIFD